MMIRKPAVGFRGLMPKLVRKRSLRAFSLVEVAIALGIMTFGLTTMLALIPVGLDTMRLSKEEVRRAQIVQQMTSQAMQMPFSELRTKFVGASPYFFTGEGEPQDKQNGDTRFIVTPAEIPAAPTPLYPGVEKARRIEQDILAIDLSIQTLPGANRFTKYVAHVPNQGN